MQDTSAVTLSTILKRSSTPDAVSKVGTWMNGAPIPWSEVTEDHSTSSDPDPSTPPKLPETTRNRTTSRNREITTLALGGQPSGAMKEYEPPQTDNGPNTLALFTQGYHTNDPMTPADDDDQLILPTSSTGRSIATYRPMPRSPPTIMRRSPVIGSPGKRKPSARTSQPTTTRDLYGTWEPESLILCGICQEDLLLVANPLEASLLPSASSQRPRYGLRFLCPGRHMYCLDCSSTYVSVKLRDMGPSAFPMRCPECPLGVKWQIDDETARKLLKRELLETWYSKRLLATISNTMLYCPNPKCSEAIDTSDIVLDVDHTECPACRSEICLKCRTIWHIGLSCEDAKNPLQGNEALQRLATRNQWRRCPQCRALVERSEGCNHMVCWCGAEFCFACGANYAEGGCTWSGGCDGEWKAETDWTERAEETVKQQSLLSRLRNIKWINRSANSKADDIPSHRARAWSRARTSPSPPPPGDTNADAPHSPKPFLPFRRLRMSQGRARTQQLDLVEIPQDWRISQNWVVVDRDSDPEDHPALATLAPPSNTRRNRRSAPPIIITEPSESGHTRNAASLGGFEVPAHRMKPLPPLPRAADSQEPEHD